MDFPQAVESLAGIEPGETEGQPRFAVETAKAARGTFQMKADAVINLSGLCHGGPDKPAAVLPQRGHSRGRNVDANLSNGASDEQVGARSGLRRRPRGEGPPRPRIQQSRLENQAC